MPKTYTMAHSVKFVDLRINTKTNSAYFYVTPTVDTDSTNEVVTDTGAILYLKRRSANKLGVLNIYAPDTGELCKADHPYIAELQEAMEEGTLVKNKTIIPGVRLTEQNIVHPTTKEVYENMFWAEYV